MDTIREVFEWIFSLIRPVDRKARKKVCVRYRTGYGPNGKLPVK